MKLSHIIAILIIAITIGIIVSTAGDASSYVCFKEAYEISKDGENKKVHVVGKLKKDVQGRIEGMHYNPIVDPNHFEFILIDNNNQEQTVIYNSPKPQDFEKSEQIVIIGNVQQNTFMAEKILMKCPSKYEDKELKESKTVSSNNL